MAFMSIPNFIKIEFFLMAKVAVRKTLYKTYGIFSDKKKKKKKKKKQKLEVMSVCITEHKAFPTSGANVSIDCI